MNRNFILAIFANTFSISGINVLIPVLPVYFLKITNNPAAMGCLIGVTSLTAFLLRPVSFTLLNRISIKNALITSSLILAIIIFLYFFNKRFIPLLLLRIVFGLAFVLFSISSWSLIGTTIPSEKKGFAISIYTISFQLPSFYAQLIGTKLSGFMPYLVAGSFLLASAVLCIFMNDIRHSDEEDKHGFFKTFFSRDLLIPGIVFFLIMLADASITVFLPIVAQIRTISDYGLYFTIFSVSTIIFRLIFGKYYSFSNYGKFVLLGLVIMLFSFILTGLSKTLVLLLISGFLYGVGLAFVGPNMYAMVLERLKHFHINQVIAGYGGFVDLGAALGPLLMGIIYQYFKDYGLYIFSAILIFIGLIVKKVYLKRSEYVRV